MNALCPFCNAVLPPLAAPPTRDKLACPRCGEAVPAARWQVDPSQPTAVTSAVAPPGSGNRRTALIVLGIMAAMAVIGLSYALWTKPFRRSHDPKVMFKPRRPLELAGMRYLPQECKIVAGWQIAEMTDAQATVGQELLAEPRPLVLDWVLKLVTHTSGLKLEQIDHLLIAPSLLPPQAVLIVKVRPEHQYQLAKIEEATQGKKSQHQDRWLYEFSLQPIVKANALLWCVEEHTLLYVIGADTPKLQALSVAERPVEKLLAPALHEVLAQRLRGYQYLWAAGQLDELAAVKEMLPLFLGGKVELGPLLEIKTFALGLEPAEGLTLTGAFHMSDAKAAAQMKTMLEGVPIERAKAKVNMPPPDGAEQWVSWQVRSDAAAFRALLNLGQEQKK